MIACTISIKSDSEFDSCGRVVDSDNPVLQWEADSNQKQLRTPIYVDCTKCQCRTNQCKHNVLEFNDFARKLKCTLDVHHKHICACPEHLNICMSFPSEALNDTFKEYASDPTQTMKYRICDFLDLGQMGLWSTYKHFVWLLLKTLLCIAYVSTLAIRPFSTLLHACGLHNVPVANAFWPQSCSPSRFLTTTTYKRPARIKITFPAVVISSVRYSFGS